MKQITFRTADLSTEGDQEQVINLVGNFSQESSHPRPLPKETQNTLASNLRKFPTTLVYFVEKRQAPISIAVCFLSFSTFNDTPIQNIHDFHIKKKFQGMGFGKQFLAFIEHQAKENGCCKVTLEVCQKNERANIFYEKHGYSGGQKDTPDNISYALSKTLE